MGLSKSTSSTAAGLSDAPRLPPLTAEWVDGLLAETGEDATLARARALADGPFHLLNPGRLRENLDSFASVARAEGVGAEVYFAHKANKSACWLPEVARAGQAPAVDSGSGPVRFGVDVASGEELVAALGGGITADSIVVTGAEKADSLLWLAVRHGCAIAADSPGELLRVGASASDAGRTARVILRALPEKQQTSRFGTNLREWVESLSSIDEEIDRGLDVLGYSIHLNGYDPVQRGREGHRLLDALPVLRGSGRRADLVDLGGGFSVRYADAEAWTRFRSSLGAADFHAGRTPSSVYPYGGQGTDGAEMFSAVLAVRDRRGNTLAERLRAEGVRVAVEPGRAALDGCGITAFPVQGVKRAPEGHSIITVAGLSMSLSEQWKSSEFLPDPSLWGEDDGGRPGAGDGSVLACVGGSSCMEYDMVSWRNISFQRKPRRGDLLVYHNTAGYQMDKNESEFHRIRLPERLVWRGAGVPLGLDRPEYTRR